jgi:hypothetical protein
MKLPMHVLLAFQFTANEQFVNLVLIGNACYHDCVRKNDTYKWSRTFSNQVSDRILVFIELDGCTNANYHEVDRSTQTNDQLVLLDAGDQNCFEDHGNGADSDEQESFKKRRAWVLKMVSQSCSREVEVKRVTMRQHCVWGLVEFENNKFEGHH